MKAIARIFDYEGYEVLDLAVSTADQTVTITLKRREDKAFTCHRCSAPLSRKRGAYQTRLEELSIMNFKTIVKFWRLKGHCARCKKARSESVGFVAKETPHMTQRLSWWIGEMCEIAAVSRVAEFVGQDNMTVRRVDFARLKRMLKHYKIPSVTHIAVDEVYARKKPRPGESRDDRFFTVVTDLTTHKVIWVSESRKKEALDQFFSIIGPKACRAIKVVATDQHDSYRASVKEYCPRAKVVWDRFHIMQGFNEAANEVRKDVFEHLSKSDPAKRLTQGKYRFVFLKSSAKRTKSEQQHIDEAMTSNGFLLRLELIKERMLTFFDAKGEDEAWRVFSEVGRWIKEACFAPLERWWRELARNWTTLKNYFSFKVTSALAEGVNNVIKTLKRRAYGYRDMFYFRLKIMQVCGYLNSRFISCSEELA